MTSLILDNERQTQAAAARPAGHCAPVGLPTDVKAISPPILTRLAQAKASCGQDTLCLFRLGDFYEAFDNDARQLAATVGLTITSKGGVALAGFPYHQLEAYLGKLIASGKRVAVCEVNCG